MDSVGGALSHAASFMTGRQGILLFTFATFKTVSDHGGYAFPIFLDPLGLFFPNTAEYHDVHHQSNGLRYNFSQPFFIHFDVLFGTRMKVETFNKMKEEKEKKRLQRSLDKQEEEKSKENREYLEKEDGEEKLKALKALGADGNEDIGLRRRNLRSETNNSSSNESDLSLTDESSSKTSHQEASRRDLDGIDLKVRR